MSGRQIPVVVRQRCDATRFDIMCQQRREATRGGDFRYSRTYKGFVLLTSPVRTPTFRAIYEQDRGDYTGEPYLWTCCPFCGGDLPDPARQATACTETGEEGG